MEAQLHINTLMLFHNIWSNPHTTVLKQVQYLMMMSKSNSVTWSNHVLLLCRKYGLPCPLKLLNQESAWQKERWKILVKTKVTIYFEKVLRKASLLNYKMRCLNTELHGISGRPHVALLNIKTTQDSKKLRLHLKFLTCDYLTADTLSRNNQSISIDNTCKLCFALGSTPKVETIEHVLVSCKVTSDVRSRILPVLLNTVAAVQPSSALLTNYTSDSELAQFILDCSSPNLPDSIRIPAHNSQISEIFKISRDWCFATHNERSRQFKNRRRLN